MAGQKRKKMSKDGGVKKRKYQGSKSKKTFTNFVSKSVNEKKYFDVGINTSVTWAGTTWADSEVPADNYVNSSGAPAAYTDSCLLPTAQGNAYGQVNGNKYKLERIRVKGIISAGILSDQADMQNARKARLLLVLDTAPSGAQAQGEDVMQDFGAESENIYAFQRIGDSGGRFKVLKDKIYNLDNIVAGTDGTNTNSLAFQDKVFKFDCPFKKPLELKIS